MAICEQCGLEHDGSYGTGRFCSYECKQEFIGLNKHSCKCKFCGREFKNGRALGGHTVFCKKNPARQKNIKLHVDTRSERFNLENPIEKHIIECSVCKKEFVLEVRKKQFIEGKYRKTCSDSCAHSRTKTEEQKQKISESISEYIRRNGKCGVAVLAESPKLLKYTCECCGDEFEEWDKRPLNYKEFFSHRFCSLECLNEHRREKCRISTKLRCENGEFGGKNNDTFKKFKRGWYRGLFCGSSWELAFAIHSFDFGKNIRRCSLKLPYKYNGTIYFYYPDFEIDEKIYEIKGFEDKKAKAKQNAYPDIIVMRYKEMKPILKYVKEKYGKDFTRLFEDKEMRD